MLRAILVSAIVLNVSVFLVSGAPTNQVANFALPIVKNNYHHAFDLGHRFNVNQDNRQNTLRQNWQNNPEIEIIKTILYASVHLDTTVTTLLPQSAGASFGAAPSGGFSAGDVEGEMPPTSMIDPKLLCSLCGK
ncbi:uncharacterized protein LOC115258992 [Aedes albopictus]|uniref:Uncharacterized protein n=1 Tax=Aedes albopictus TaxID=7160 RepID=A0ABM1YA77_AEDAL|nr:uncharacterized protein LOC115258992 [Aedes albopictus]